VTKTIEKPMVFIDFSRSGAPKNDPKTMPKCNRKNIRKKPRQNRFLPPFWPPKTPQNHSKIDSGREKNESWTKPVSRRYGTHPGVVANQRELRLLDCENGFAYD